MENREFVYQCSLRTFGLDTARFEKICGDLRSKDVDIKFEEANLQGKITISKSSVDSIALESVLTKINMRLEDYIYTDKDLNLNEYLVKLLIKKGEMMSIAESITGGMISSSICDVDGASKVLYESMVTYNNGAKVRRLHVPATTLEDYTAVSRETCEAMLKGTLANKEIVYAIATTGFANHSDKDLCGKVYIGYGSLNNYKIDEVHFSGDRNIVRQKACNYAIYCLIKLIDKYERNY